MIETLTPTLKGEALYKKVRHDFIGLDKEYKLAGGDKSKRVYLDSTASTQMKRTVYRAAE